MPDVIRHFGAHRLLSFDSVIGEPGLHPVSAEWWTKIAEVTEPASRLPGEMERMTIIEPAYSAWESETG